MQTTKQTSHRRMSNRLNPSPRPLPATHVPALYPSRRNAVLKTPERPIVLSRGSSESSYGSSSNASTPLTAESPLTSMETTPDSASLEFVFSKETINRTFPNEITSLPASLENDLDELSSDNDQPTADTPLRNLTKRRRISIKSSPDAVDVAVSGSRPRLLQHLDLRSAPKQQIGTKPRVPGTYEFQNSDVRPDCVSSELRVPYTSAQETDDESEVTDSVQAPEDTVNNNEEVVFKAISTVPKDVRAINIGIYKYITSERKLTKKPRKPGWIYIFESESPKKAPGHVKIGKTDINPERRKKDWEECGFALLEVEDSYRNAFDHYSIVETLVMAELHNCRKKFQCTNHGIPHQEWYEVDRESALAAITRWRNWIILQRPLDATSKLTPYWRWRANKLPRFIADVDWDVWTQPSRLDYLDYKLEQFGDGQYIQIKAHLARKDFHFCLTGGMIIFILYTKFGKAAALWGLLALLAL